MIYYYNVNKSSEELDTAVSTILKFQIKIGKELGDSFVFKNPTRGKYNLNSAFNY